MKRLFNMEETLILSLGCIVNDQYLNFQVSINNLYIYTLKNKAIINELLGHENIIRYLDHFIIFLPKRYELQSVFWKEFYYAFGKDYEKLINISNNIFCINEMVNYITKTINTNENSILLDYGCGSGLSMNSNFIGKIVGYEPIFSMRQQARKKGLHILGNREFNKLPNNYFDAGFASYVFHMAIEEKSIYQLTQKMKESAVLIVNFYKDINANIINQIFNKLDYRAIKIMDTEERFGSIYEYIRG